MMEAMACELPVVASSVGGAVDVIEADDNGFLFKSGDHLELAQKLVSILKERDRLPETGARARKTAMTYADLDAVANRLSELYHELAHHR